MDCKNCHYVTNKFVPKHGKMIHRRFCKKHTRFVHSEMFCADFIENEDLTGDEV